MEWHEQIVADRRAAAWKGFQKIAVVSVLFVIGGFVFMQWLTAAAASGELREMVASRLAGMTATAVVEDRRVGADLPTRSPFGDVIEVLDAEMQTAKGDYWDIVPSDLPATMVFDVRFLVDEDRRWFMLLRNTDDGGGLTAPKHWHCRRIDDRGASVCDPEDHDPETAVTRYVVMAVQPGE